MQKISSQEASAVLKQASTAIRHLSAENQKLNEKVAEYERTRRIEKIAQSMEDKGINEDLSFEEKVAQLHKADLDVTEQAVDMAAPNMKLASVDHDSPAGNMSNAFETYILTGEDVTE